MLLDRVQKKQPIIEEAAALLRKQGLIEGARTTDNKIDCIRNHDSSSRDELVKLVLDKLSDVLDEKQKLNKFRSLLHAMSKRDQTVVKSGGLHKGRWIHDRHGCV